MTFQELVQEVIIATNRPDMDVAANGGSGEIPAAVRKSTMTLHTKELFPKDIITAQIKFDTAAFIQTLELNSIPRFRKISYLRKWDPTFLTYQLNPYTVPPLVDTGYGYISTNQALALIKILDPGFILDDYGQEKSDVAYLTGDGLAIRSSTSLLYALLGWYQYPNIGNSSGVGYDSWIARDYPYAITSHAASAIFSSIGQQDVSRKMDGPTGEVTEHVQILIQNNLLASA